MELYTLQLGKWRLAEKQHIPHIDTTARQGLVLSPEWPLVAKYKSKTITEDEYTQEYLALLRMRYSANPEAFLKYAHMPKLAVMCYCRNGSFCHRHLLVGVFEKICAKHQIPFLYQGELE